MKITVSINKDMNNPRFKVDLVSAIYNKHYHNNRKTVLIKHIIEKAKEINNQKQNEN